MNYQEILAFWFEELKPASWWKKDLALDTLITERFEAVHTRAIGGELSEWRSEPKGRLAEIIVLDQFSRNMFRDTPKAFSYDGIALDLAEKAVAKGEDQKLIASQRHFLYMPYMHSESKDIHLTSIALFKSLANDLALKAAKDHKRIIDRFGRYPHRNTVLDRVSTDEESKFLKEPGSSF